MNAQRRTWQRKFRDAFRGAWIAYRDNSSYWVHTAAAAAATMVGILLRFDPWRWAVLTLCIFVVFAAETLNTAIEEMAKAVDSTHNEHVRDALDIGSAAVLWTAAGAVVVGVILMAGT